MSRFRRPCVLDMKLGWRTYGDDAAQRKIDSQEAKCKATTSSSLGIRICGLQVSIVEAYYGKQFLILVSGISHSDSCINY